MSAKEQTEGDSEDSGMPENSPERARLIAQIAAILKAGDSANSVSRGMVHIEGMVVDAGNLIGHVEERHGPVVGEDRRELKLPKLADRRKAVRAYGELLQFPAVWWRECAFEDGWEIAIRWMRKNNQ